MSRGPLTTTQLRAAWSPPCAAVQGVKVELHGGAVITIDKRIVPAVLAMNAVFSKWNYKATPPDTGAFVCRRITGGTGYSLHAFGIAIDINWQSNPYGRKLVTDMPKAMVAEIKALRTGNGKQVWRWGGDYTTNKDAMHFEIVCTPADLATGIKGGAAPAPPQGSGIPHDVLRQGAKGDKVTAVQYTLNFLGHRCTVDGVWGPKTTAAVKSFQTACKNLGASLIVDGLWGPQTAALAEWWTVATLAGKR